jgi:hypothetical protein
MKFIPFFALLISVTPLVAEDAAKPANESSAPEAKSLMPNQEEFLNLPQEARTEFGKHLVEAHRLARQKRTFEAMDELNKGALIFAFSPEIHNLRGSCYIEMRAFDKALVEFQKASSFATRSPSIEYNIAEIYFCTKEWVRAIKMFEKILAEQPKGAGGLFSLLEFKLMLSHLKLGNAAQVKKLTDKYGYADDSPFYYYAKASEAFEAKDAAKAEEWLRSAARIFRDPSMIEVWNDAIREYGYLYNVNATELVKP